MNTNDPRFQNAYNDLIGAFFRFINVVNPAPTRDEQIRLICDSMTSLVNILKATHSDSVTVATETSQQSDLTVEQPTLQLIQQSTNGAATDVTKPVADQTIAAPQTAAASMATELRYAMQPTFTGEDVFKFINRSLRRESAFDTKENPDAPDIREYAFILDLGDTEGNFTVNPKTILSALQSSPSEVVQVEGAITMENLEVIALGKIVKAYGGWKVTSPLKLKAKVV
jgi:hypothetical protein